MRLSPKEHNLDDAFRDRLKDLEAQPSELAWVGIEATLPARSVLASPFRIIGGLAAVATVASFGILAALGDSPMSSALLAHETQPKRLQFVERSPELLSAAAPELVLTHARPISSTSEVASISVAAPGFSAEVYADRPALLPGHGTEAISTDPSALGDLNELEPKLIDESNFRGLRIGGLTGINNTWLFSTHGSGNAAITGYRPTFGPAFGFAVGYDLNSRSAVEADFIVSSSEGQRYDIMTEQGPMTTTAKVNYLRIPVLFKKRVTAQSGLLNTAYSINYVAGLQYGRLNWVSVDPDVNLINEDNFNKQELGVILGLEYDLYFSRSYALTFGARAAVNNDINAFPFFMSDEYAESANFSLGAQVKLSYLIRPRS
jgi:hypothetical protein